VKFVPIANSGTHGLTKFREIAISKLLQKDFDVECFAIDPLSKTEEDEYFYRHVYPRMVRKEIYNMTESDLY
jgi:hypothetical protein